MCACYPCQQETEWSAMGGRGPLVSTSWKNHSTPKEII